MTASRLKYTSLTVLAVFSVQTVSAVSGNGTTDSPETFSTSDISSYFVSPNGYYLKKTFALESIYNYASSGSVDFGSASSGHNLYIGHMTTNSSMIGTGAALIISGGSTVNDYAGFIGDTVASTSTEQYTCGSVTVTGDGSEWTNVGTLQIGAEESHQYFNEPGSYKASPYFLYTNYCSANLTVADGGTVTSAGGSIYGIATYDFGTSTSGGIVNTATVTGKNATSGNASTWNFGSVGLEIHSFGKIDVANGGVVTGTGVTDVYSDGILLVESGGSLSTEGIAIHSAAATTITGANSKLICSGSITVQGGSTDAGSLTISDGGAASSADGSIYGNATVTGSGSAWNLTGALTLSYSTDTSVTPNVITPGTLNLADGGSVTAASMQVNDGILTIADDGSLLECKTGTLQVNNGGSVTVRNGGSLATDAQSIIASGTKLTVTGVNATSGNASTWNYKGNVSCAGTLDVESGAKITGSALFTLTGNTSIVGSSLSSTGTFSVSSGSVALSDASGLAASTLAVGGVGVNNSTISANGAGSYISADTVTVGGVISGSYSTGCSVTLSDGALLFGKSLAVNSDSMAVLGTSNCIKLNNGFVITGDSSGAIDAILSGKGILVYNSSDKAYEAAVEGSNFYKTECTSVAALQNALGTHAADYNAFLSGLGNSFDYYVLSDMASVPEPSAYAFVGGLGALGLLILKKKRR